MLEVTGIDDRSAAAWTLGVAITTVHTRIIALLTARAQAREVRRIT